MSKRSKRERIDIVSMYEAASASAIPIVASSSSSAPPAPPVDTFSPQAFLSNILRTQSLKELLETDSSMIKEIKDLENNMKALVYANYNKFIAASTTIHQMRGKVGGMEEEMKKLAANVERITATSDKVSGTLQSKRELIEQLSGVHHLLQKLQFLVDLPSRLRQSIASEKFDEAVTYYRKTHLVLDRYKHFPSFQPIDQQCTEIITNLTKQLSDKYFAPNASFETLSQLAPLLLNLDVPAKNVSQVFVAKNTDTIKKIFVNFESAPLVSPPAENSTANPTPAQIAFHSVSLFSDSFLSATKQFISTYLELFVQHKTIKKADKLPAIKVLETTVQQFLDSFGQIIKKFLLKIAAQEGFSSNAASNSGNASSENIRRSTFSVVDQPKANAADQPVSPASEVLRCASLCIDQVLDAYWIILHPDTVHDDHKLITGVKEGSTLHDTGYYINSLVTSLLDLSFDDLYSSVEQSITQGMKSVISVVDEIRALPHFYLPSSIASSTPTMLYTPQIAGLTPQPVSSPNVSGSSSNTLTSSTLSPTEIVNVQENVETLQINLRSSVENITTGILARLDMNFGSKLTVLFQLCSPGSFLESAASSLLNAVQIKIRLLLQKIVIKFENSSHSSSTNAPISKSTSSSNVSSNTSTTLDNSNENNNTSSSSLLPISYYYSIVAPLVFEAIKSRVLPMLSTSLGQTVHNTRHFNLGIDAIQAKIIEFGQELALASQTQLTNFVRDIASIKIGGIMRAAVESPNQLRHKEPRAVDSAIELALVELKLILRPMSLLYDMGAKKERRRALLGSYVTEGTRDSFGSSATPSSTSPKRTLVITSEIMLLDQLFQKKINYFEKVNSNFRSIATGIIKITLKNYLESVRLTTFGAYGYQQAQVDIHFLNLGFDDLVSDPVALDAVLMDTLVACKERCTDPISLDPAIIAKLCSEAYSRHIGNSEIPINTP